MSNVQDISNAREVEQREIMEELAKTGECFLCQTTVARIAAKYPRFASPSIKSWQHWFVKKNDFPYDGTKLHLLIIPYRHVTSLEELSVEEFSELKTVVEWVNVTYKVKGASMFVRYGNMSYTGATGTHIHFHLLHGVEKYENCESIKPKLGYK